MWYVNQWTGDRTRELPTEEARALDPLEAAHRQAAEVRIPHLSLFHFVRVWLFPVAHASWPQIYGFVVSGCSDPKLDGLYKQV